MKVLEAVKRGFTEANKLLKVAGIFFAYNVITGLLSLPLANPERAGEAWVIAVAIILAIISFAVFVLIQGGAMGVIKDQIKTGKNDLSRFIDHGKKYYLRILLLLLMYLLIGIVAVLVLTLLYGFTFLLEGNEVLTALFLMGLVLLSIAVAVFLLYPLYTIVVEDRSVLESFKKGVKVAKENYLSTLGLFSLLLLISFIISLFVSFIGTLAAAPFPVAEDVIITVVNAVAQSYIPLVMIVAFMSFYMGLTGPEVSENVSEQAPEVEGPGDAEVI